MERYFLQPERLAGLHRRFAELILKLNCYWALTAFPGDGEQGFRNPPPEQLAAWICGEGLPLRIELPEDHSRITLERDELYMTVWDPGETLRERLAQLAAAAGLFLWQPPQEEPAKPDIALSAAGSGPEAV